MKAQPLESSIMLAGLTRGLWMGARADPQVERRGSLAKATSWRSPSVSNAGMHEIAGEDCATDPTSARSDRG